MQRLSRNFGMRDLNFDSVKATASNGAWLKDKHRGSAGMWGGGSVVPGGACAMPQRGPFLTRGRSPHYCRGPSTVCPPRLNYAAAPPPPPPPLPLSMPSPFPGGTFVPTVNATVKNENNNPFPCGGWAGIRLVWKERMGWARGKERCVGWGGMGRGDWDRCWIGGNIMNSFNAAQRMTMRTNYCKIFSHNRRVSLKTFTVYWEHKLWNKMQSRLIMKAVKYWSKPGK